MDRGFLKQLFLTLLSLAVLSSAALASSGEIKRVPITDAAWIVDLTSSRHRWTQDQIELVRFLFAELELKAPGFMARVYENGFRELYLEDFYLNGIADVDKG